MTILVDPLVPDHRQALGKRSLSVSGRSVPPNGQCRGAAVERMARTT